MVYGTEGTLDGLMRTKISPVFLDKQCRSTRICAYSSPEALDIAVWRVGVPDSVSCPGKETARREPFFLVALEVLANVLWSVNRPSSPVDCYVSLIGSHTRKELDHE